MKRPHKGKRRSKSDEHAATNPGKVDSVIPPSVVQTHSEILEREREIHEALTRHLHELLNSLWAASLQIELACDMGSCPVELRHTLEQIRSSILEAMETAAQTSTLIETSLPSIVVDSRFRDCDPS
jgi:hypothetical protein